MGNPISLIDPTGKGPEDIGLYTVDENGKITSRGSKASKSNYDMIYTEENWNNEIWKGERIDSQGMLEDLTKIQVAGMSSFYGTDKGTKSDRYKLFKYMADNTNVEWTIVNGNVNGKKTSFLGTSGREDAAVSAFSFPIDKGSLTYQLHSHPGTIGISGRSNANELESMGSEETSEFRASGDRRVIREMEYYYNNDKTFTFNVYFKHSKNLYSMPHHGRGEIKYLKTVSNSSDLITE